MASGDAFTSAWQAVAGGTPAATAAFPTEPMNVDTRGINEGLLANPKAEIATFDKAKATKQRKASDAAALAQREAEIQAVQNSPWTKLGNALTQQFQQTETPVAAAVSGSEIPGAQAGAANQALASLGLSPDSSAGQWLSSQTAASQATTAPVAQAMKQEGAQYAAEQGPISAAIAAYGQANALSDITAPEASWLNALASHVQTNLSYQGVVPTASLPSLAPSVAKALQLSGGYGGTAGAGTTPLQNVGPAVGGGSKAVGAGNTLAGAGTLYGSVPGTSPGGSPA